MQLLGGEWKRSLPRYRKLVTDCCIAALPAGKSGDISVVLADNAALRDLNHTYRGKDKPTNVLSFAGSEGNIGDIILAYETVCSEAEAQHKTVAQHTAHLVVHGCLHLLGYDHETEHDAHAMEAREIKILSSLGVPNPYEVARA